MKNKIRNHSSIILLTCWLCVVVAKDASNLKILRNVDRSLVEVPSKVEVAIGANLTLICRIDNNKEKESSNGYVAWFIPPKKPFKSKLTDLRKSSKLELNNVNVKDKGFYVCIGLKYKIFKSVYLVVEKLETGYLKTLRRKRDIVYGNDPYGFNFTNTREWEEELQKRIDKMAKDLDSLNINNNYENNDIYESNNNYDTNNNYGSNNNYDLTYVNSNPSADNSFPGKSIALIFGVFFVVFVIWVIIRYFGTSDENETDNRNNRQQNGSSNPRINANRYRDDTLRTDPEFFDALEIHRPLTYDTSIDSTELDLPPTYLSSTHNSTQNLHSSADRIGVNAADNNKFILPPSYDEAVGREHDNHNVCSANSNMNHHHSENDHIASGDTNSECNNEGGGDSGVCDSEAGGNSGGGDDGGGGDSGGGGDCGGGGSDD